MQAAHIPAGPLSKLNPAVFERHSQRLLKSVPPFCRLIQRCYVFIITPYTTPPQPPVSDSDSWESNWPLAVEDATSRRKIDHAVERPISASLHPSTRSRVGYSGWLARGLTGVKIWASVCLLAGKPKLEVNLSPPYRCTHRFTSIISKTVKIGAG